MTVDKRTPRGRSRAERCKKWDVGDRIMLADLLSTVKSFTVWPAMASWFGIQRDLFQGFCK